MKRDNWIEVTPNSNEYIATHVDKMGNSDLHVCPYFQDLDKFAFVHPGSGTDEDVLSVYVVEDADVVVTNKEVIDAGTMEVKRGRVEIRAVLDYMGSLEEYNAKKKRKGSDLKAVGYRGFADSTFRSNSKKGIRVVRMKGSKPNVES